MNIQKIVFSKKEINKIRQENGVYIFWKNNTPLYVGKSRSLKDRLKSYFLKDLLPKTKKMIKETNNFSFIYVSSELEALLLEARLVKKYNTKYNIQLKDDKNPLYIKISDDEFPIVSKVRKRSTFENRSNYWGPFLSSRNVNEILKISRKLFPYSTHKIGKKACFYNQIGLCDPCPNSVDKIVDKRDYKKYRDIYVHNIVLLKKLLNGNIVFVKNDLKKTMLSHANKQNYEKASVIKSKIDILNYITQQITPVSSFIKNPNLLYDIRENELKQLKIFIKKHFKVSVKTDRIECYDVSHFSGANPSASMVTFKNGEPYKTMYRRFKIRQKYKKSDTDSLREVIKRRINRFADWGIPDIIIVDGGKPQVSVFSNELKGYKIFVAGLAKSQEKLVYNSIYKNESVFMTKRLRKGPAMYFVQRLRDESHRFAQSYRKVLLKKSFI